ncbi:hypothetical protein [Pelagicoccus albus]|uniref:Uncharacterized protein n=1 Tax=Pelagicoccus albus TaxID=415222 RepID=A0A7X1E7E5_9BACT|nr:hypothetical protein [Pelagicoccus albus]MBC2605058.1 hypothetical protein [Pelagicoccus albus]
MRNPIARTLSLAVHASKQSKDKVRSIPHALTKLRILGLFVFEQFLAAA